MIIIKMATAIPPIRPQINAFSGVSKYSLQSLTLIPKSKQHMCTSQLYKSLSAVLVFSFASYNRLSLQLDEAIVNGIYYSLSLAEVKSQATEPSYFSKLLMKKSPVSVPIKNQLLLNSAIASTEATTSLLRSQFTCLLYTSPSPRDRQKSRMPSSA
eukprot:TRINITY_DN19140_c0_g1_i1.p2 TRINITY_DN19140_c0_g1~~TRINITY_DN19140_c0_g1_i1.p2  ORF type:complete len:156 (+),score=22.13 TRINITY_DN19140_c0_g1_i1:131-598(+)